MTPRPPGGGVSDLAGQKATPSPSQTLHPQQASDSQDASTSGQSFMQANFQHIAIPPKPAPGKATLKALPTVRDHTTDQLDAGLNEYIPREVDEFGEDKVMPNGQLSGKRQYRCRTFLVANRGDKLFMLATECARVLGYRDSYLLFNKNRSLHKIIAGQEEKDDLITQEVLPFSYRSRQIAIVTARSIFRQFGSRVIDDGRRVRDDYWETKARKQGFTEQDLASDKRPGAAKAREAAAASAAATAASTSHQQINVGGTGDIVYAPSGQYPAPSPLLAPPDPNEARNRELSGTLKGPRQEITAPPFIDMTRPSPISEIQIQSQHAADYNRSINEQRELRSEFVAKMWQRPHESANMPTMAQSGSGHAGSGSGGAGSVGEATLSSAAGRTSQPPHPNSGSMPNHSPRLMMTNNTYPQPVHSHGSVGQGASRGMSHQQAQSPSQYGNPIGGRSVGIGMGIGPATGTGPGSYNYVSTGQMWQPQQQHHPHQSHPQHHPLHHPQHTLHQPSQPQHHQQQSVQGHYSGYAAVQSPPIGSSMSPQQLRHPAGGQTAAQYSGMPAIQGYGQQTGIYGEQTPRQYLTQNSPEQPAATPGWSNQQQQPPTHQWWQNQ